MAGDTCTERDVYDVNTSDYDICFEVIQSFDFMSFTLIFIFIIDFKDQNNERLVWF